MKRFLILLSALACAAFVQPCYAKSKNTTKANKKAMDTLSYCTGVSLYYTINQICTSCNIYDINTEQIKSGINEGLTNYPHPSSEEQLKIAYEFFNSTLPKRSQEFYSKNKYNPNAVFVPFTSKEENATVSYALGVGLGESLSKSSRKIEPYWLLKAFDEAKAKRMRLNTNQISAYMEHYNTVVVPAEANERSKRWLAAKEQEPGVKKTASGLLYKIIEQGDMTKAACYKQDVVFVHYIGRYQNGEVFEASRFNDLSKEEQDRQRKEYPDAFNKYGRPYVEDRPYEFELRRVIAGWTEGLQLIGPGGKIILYVPAELAYGAKGAGKKIGPNEALEFEVEIVSVKFSSYHEAILRDAQK